MNRRATAVAIGGVAIVALLLAWWAASIPEGAPEAAAPVVAATPPPEAKPTEVRLLFPGRDGFLHAELRPLQLPAGEEEAAVAVITSLLAGPVDTALVAPMPGNVAVEAVRIAPDGLAFLLLHSDDEPPSSGSDAERLRIYSLVNTLVGHLPAIDRVALLWNDVQRPSLGHFDTGHALGADLSLEAPQP